VIKSEFNITLKMSYLFATRSVNQYFMEYWLQHANWCCILFSRWNVSFS